MDNTPSDNKLKKYIHIGVLHYHANNYFKKRGTTPLDYSLPIFTISRSILLTHITILILSICHHLT